MARSPLIQNQQDFSVTEVHKSLNCCSAKVSNFLLFWLDQGPLPLSSACCLRCQRPVIVIVLLSSLRNYGTPTNTLNSVHAAGVVLPARVMQMCLWYVSTEHSLIRECLLRAKHWSPVLCYHTTESRFQMCIRMLELLLDKPASNKSALG